MSITVPCGRWFRCASFVLALALILTAVSFSSFFSPAAHAALGAADDAKITALIYPTLGNPAIIRKGQNITIEFNPRWNAVPVNSGPLFNAKDWVASVTSTNSAFPSTYNLEFVSCSTVLSTVWPNLKSGGVYIHAATFKVPESVPEHLYDIRVGCTWMTIGGDVPLSDSQPHGLQVVNEYKTDFNFCQLTDIHVFGPENPDAGIFYSQPKHERGQRRTTYDPNVGYGATYYHKTIMQLNRIKPDFLIYTGDYDFGQRYTTMDNATRGYGNWGTTTEYEFEQLWFYQETLTLDVPVFIVMGNHDGYDEGTNGAQEDWFNNWTKLYGPLYFSFDYGDAHFTAINTMDWTSTDRTLTDWLRMILQPEKYKGMVRGGGDAYEDGYSQARINTLDEEHYTAQLRWIRDDLRAHQSASIRVCAYHHDPWKEAGSGSMWSGSEQGWLEAITGTLMNMGDGEGRLALLKLEKDYNVALAVSGHDHSDIIGTLPWTNGRGSTIHANTTSTSLQADGNSDSYPGYRRVFVSGGTVTNYNYQNPRFSVPTYNGSVIGGTTNLMNLVTPAVESSFSPAPGAAEDVTCTIVNHLAKAQNGCSMEFPMPKLTGGYYYKVTNGTFAELYENAPTNDHTICRVTTDVAAGQTKNIRVYKSATPDATPPTGSVSIDNGADASASLNVVLKLSAADSESGVRDMMISNSSSFTGAAWQSYKTACYWTLSGGGQGEKVVYVRFRDNAGNVVTAYDRVNYTTAVDPGGPADTWYFAEGCTRPGFEEWISLQNPNDAKASVSIEYMMGEGDNLKKDVEISGNSRYTVNVNEAVGPGKDVSAKITSDQSIIAERPMYFNYQGMWDGGHDVIGTKSPRTKWYFAEGCTRETPAANFHTWICMQNPQSSDATVKLTYMMESGGTKQVEVTVPAKGRKTSCANADVGPGQDISIMVESSKEIICERPMYFNYAGKWDDGHDVVGAGAPATEWFLAEGTTYSGFATYVCIQNPNSSEAKTTLKYMLQDGTAPDQEVTVPANSRKTVSVNDWIGPAKNVSVRLTSDQPVITERSMYFSYGPGWDGGHCVMGAVSSHGSWYFSEGCTRPGFDEWFSIQNPRSTKASVTINYLLNEGAPRQQTLQVEPFSRATVKVNDFLTGEFDVSATVESTSLVIVERPMYFNYKGVWTGGHCVVGSGAD